MAQKPRKKKLFMALAGARFLREAARIHCTAVGELQQARKWFDNHATVVMPYLMDLNPFENLPGPESGLNLLAPANRGAKKLLFLSRLHEKKGVHLLIRAAGLMRDAGTPFILMIAGTGDPLYVEKLNNLVAELKLWDRVFFLGLVTGEKKISLYQAADLFVLPTAQENFGLVLTEALACGLPVLTTRGTDIWQEVSDAGGLIIDPAPESIAAQATKLLEDPTDLHRRRELGRKWVMAEMAIEPISRKYEAVYQEMMK
jgi:glycosyltransferase involved in cell wall biosynthesis